MIRLKTLCPLCGEKASYRDVRRLSFNYKGNSITLLQPGSWCDACGEGVLEPEDNKATREALQAYL